MKLFQMLYNSLEVKPNELKNFHSRNECIYLFPMDGVEMDYIADDVCIQANICMFEQSMVSRKFCYDLCKVELLCS